MIKNLLDEVLHQVADFRERSGQLRDRVWASLMYPAFIFILSIVVSVFLMTVVVPMLMTNLLEMGAELPWPTRVLKWGSDTLLTHGWWIGMKRRGCLGSCGLRRGVRRFPR